MIVFACLFILGFASTWGPLVWAVVGEIYPTRYRAKAMGLATASNWTWNFLLAFFTPFITAKIDYRYGYVFATMCFVGAVFVYFMVCESQGRTLEEIDTMYLYRVKAWQSSKWKPTDGEKGPNLDDTYLTPGARDIRKPSVDGPGEGTERKEVAPPSGGLSVPGPGARSVRQASEATLTPADVGSSPRGGALGTGIHGDTYYPDGIPPGKTMAI